MKVILRLAVLMLFVIFCSTIFSQNGSNEGVGQAKVEEILSKAKEYCHRLENAVFDFVCLEEITEEIRLPPEIRRVFPGESEWVGVPQLMNMKRSRKNKYLYEYQLIRKKEKNEERRTLLEKNGKKKTEKEALLETSRFYYEKMVFGPIDLFRRFGDLYLDWKIVKEENLNQGRAVVLEAVRKSGLTQFYPYGKIWLRESDFAIMKIEWNERSFANYQVIEEQAKKSQTEPWITLVSEFKVEKNGIRFPSRLFCEEVYIDHKGKKIKSSETTIIYKDYKFFTVETEVKY